MLTITDEDLIKCTISKKGLSTNKYITFNDLMELLKASSEERQGVSEVKYLKSPILPNSERVSTVFYAESDDNRYRFILHRKPDSIDINYGGTVFQKCGVPGLLFYVNVYQGIMQSVKIVAVRDKFLRPNTKLYKYPFGNVNKYPNSTLACFGSNSIGSIDVTDKSKLHSLPDLFLSMPTGDDYYVPLQNAGLSQRMLFEKLSNNDFPEEFYCEFDTHDKQGLTLEQWV